MKSKLIASLLFAAAFVFTACAAEKKTDSTAETGEQMPPVESILIIDGVAFYDGCTGCDCPGMENGKCTCPSKADCPCCRKNLKKCSEKLQKKCLEAKKSDCKQKMDCKKESEGPAKTGN